MANDPRNQDQERITDEDVVGRVAGDEEEFDDEDQLDEDDQDRSEGADDL